MEFIKKVWNKIKNPKPIYLGIFYAFFVIILSATLFLVITQQTQTVLHYILYCLSALSLTYFVYTIIIFAPKIKDKIIQFLNNHKFTKTMLENYGYRTIIFSVFSFILNISYVIFLLVMSILTQSFWYYSITAYYFVLSLIKASVFYSKKKHDTEEKQIKNHRLCGILFIVLMIAFSGVIVLIYTSNMYFEYAGLMIYAIAAFTFYKLTLAIVNMFKAHNQNDLCIQSIRNINLANALISLLVLQVALFQAFSPQSNTSFANALTGGAIAIAIISLGIFMIIKSNKILKNNKINQNKNTQQDIDTKEETNV